MCRHHSNPRHVLLSIIGIHLDRQALWEVANNPSNVAIKNISFTFYRKCFLLRPACWPWPSSHGAQTSVLCPGKAKETQTGPPRWAAEPRLPGLPASPPRHPCAPQQWNRQQGDGKELHSWKSSGKHLKWFSPKIKALGGKNFNSPEHFQEISIL